MKISRYAPLAKRFVNVLFSYRKNHKYKVRIISINLKRMCGNIKTFAKVILIGVLTTVFRVIGQLLIPTGTPQTVLQPSIFSANGTLPIVFMVYGIIAYSILSAMYLLIRENLSGYKLGKGLKYGMACAIIWTSYLLEPLPHVISLLDKVTYPIADSAALIVMGLLLGLFLSKSTPSKTCVRKSSRMRFDVLLISAFFVVGRFIQYSYFKIYSSFETEMVQTLLWVVLAGIAISFVVLWFNGLLPTQNKWTKALLTGLVLFGVDLLLFNLFVPLVFSADILDLIIRTVVDTIAVTIGLLVTNIQIAKAK